MPVEGCLQVPFPLVLNTLTGDLRASESVDGRPILRANFPRYRMRTAARSLMVLGITSTVLLVGGMACTDVLDAGRISDCVEVYPNTGATRRPGFTKAACEEHCRSIQGTLDCYWDEDAARSAAVHSNRRSALLALLNEPEDLSRLGVPPQLELGEDDFTVQGDLKGPA